jgi:hypothetical protein
MYRCGSFVRFGATGNWFNYYYAKLPAAAGTYRLVAVRICTWLIDILNYDAVLR